MSRTPDLSQLERLQGWEGLPETQREQVKTETIAAHEDRRNERESRLSLGKRLKGIREILEPVDAWIEWCREVFHMSVPTVYRYINYYEVVSKKVPKSILTTALKLGYELPERAIESSRAPKSDDPEEIVRYLERINASRPKIFVIEHNPDEVIRTMLNDFALGFNKLPKMPRTRTTAFEKLVGMMMTRVGYTKPHTFAPVAIAEKYVVKRGRPVTNAA